MNRRSRILTAFFFTALNCLAFLAGCSRGGSYIAEISDKYRIPDDKQLVVYTSHKEEVYLPIIREFENTTGIYVDIRTGGSAEIFKAVRDAGDKSDCDVLFGGGIESYEAGKELLLPYVVEGKEKLDPLYLSDGDYWTPFTELPLVFVYNRKLVAASEVPASWDELVNSRWKGKFAFADLYNSGTSYTVLATYSQLKGKSPEETVRLFNELTDGRILESSGQIIPQISNGNYLVGVTLEETALKAVESGDDIAMIYPSDKTSALPDGCAICKYSKHSYNAGVFLDFVVNYETQSFAVKEFKRRSVRSDVELPGGFSDISQMDFDIERAAGEEESFFAAWDEYMKGGAQ